MPYRINHIHLKAPDPRTTAEGYVTAFRFSIVSDEVRVARHGARLDVVSNLVHAAIV